MPFDFESLSKEEKDDILNPVCHRDSAYENSVEWPVGQAVGFPSEYPTTSHWIKGFRSPLDYHRTTPEVPTSCDVLIIGTGITGCSVAYYLTKERPDLKITVVDARGFCSGATGRNGGHCFRPEGFDMRSSAKDNGLELTLATRRAHIKIRNIMQDVIAEHDIAEKIDCNFSGGVHLFVSQEERDDHIKDLEFCEELGFEHESIVVNAEEMSKILEVRNEFGGLFTKKSGSFWPRKFVAAIMEIAMERGNINLQTNTCVTSIEASTETSSRWVANTARGQIHAGQIIHATNAYVGALLPEIMGTEQEVVPMPDMVVAARPSPTASSSGTWPVNILSNYGNHWLVQMPKEPHTTQENLVVYGFCSGAASTNDEVLLDNVNDRLDQQRKYLAYSFPQKFSVADDQGRIPLDSIESVWTGIIGMTRDDSTMVGPVKGKAGQFMCAGFNGQGMARCWGSGLVLTDMLLWEMRERRKEPWKAAGWYPAEWLKNLDHLPDQLPETLPHRPL